MMDNALGRGRKDSLLQDSEVREIIGEAAGSWDLSGKRILLIVPDNTRSCPMGLMYRSIYEAFAPMSQALDVLVALGTHQPMPIEAIYAYFDLDAETHRRKYPKTHFYNHAFNDPAQLRDIGTIPAEKMKALSGGLMTEAFPVSVNKMLFDYDAVVIVGPTFPHEVVGFSGGNKYFFPGIAGADIINAFHWLGALITNREIIGTHYTPVRAVVDHCASMIKLPKFCFSLVVSSKGLHGLYAGPPEAAYEKAARLSAEVNVKWFEKPFHTVLSVCPPMYPELWTAGKCMYKLEPVVADGGTLIIYAPHIREVSATHGRIIEEIGYHCLAYFTEQWERYRHYPAGVLAHSTHVRGGGRFSEGCESCNVNVILATGIPRETCERINLGYMDPASIEVESYAGREEEGVLLVRKAGEVLHKLESDRK